MENNLSCKFLSWIAHRFRWFGLFQYPMLVCLDRESINVDDIQGSKGKALLFCKDGPLEMCLRRTKLCPPWEKELVARQRLVSPWWQRWSLCWSHTGVSWSAVGVGGTWSLPWSERWSVGEVGLSKLVRALPGQWGKCFLAERKTHSRSPGWNLEDISWDSFNPVCVCNDKRGVKCWYSAWKIRMSVMAPFAMGVKWCCHTNRFE